MKIWKNLGAACCAAVLLISLVACGNHSSQQSGISSDSTSSGNKTYIIAMDTTFSPFEFEDASGKRVGIDVELLEAVAEDQGITIEMQALGFDAALAAVQAGQADAIMAGCSITEKRKETFDFSESYFDSGIAMAVTADNNEITSYEDLRGKNVCAKVGTESAMLLNGDNSQEGLATKYGFTVTLMDDSPTMYEDVKIGNSVACFDDYPVLGYSIAQGSGLKIVGEMERGSSYGLGVKKGKNSQLLTHFNNGLANLRENGKYQEILDKYIQK